MQRRQFTQASLAGALLCATAQHAWALSLGNLTNADAAMYRARQSGRNQYRFYGR